MPASHHPGTGATLGSGESPLFRPRNASGSVSHYFERTKPQAYEINWKAKVRERVYFLGDVPTDHPEYVEIARLAVEVQGGIALQYYFGPEAGFPELAALGVSKNAGALMFVHWECPGFAAMAESAVGRNHEMLIHTDSGYPDYAALAKRAIQKNADAFEYVNSRVPDYKEIATFAVEKSPRALRHVRPEHGPLYYSLAKSAVRADGLMLEYVGSRHPKFEDFAKLAVEQNGKALRHVPKEHASFLAFALAAIKQTWEALHVVPIEHPQYVELASFAIVLHGVQTLCPHPGHPKFVELLEIAMNRDGMELECLEMFLELEEIEGIPVLSEDQYCDLARLAVQQNPNALRFVNESFARYDELARLVEQQEAAATGANAQRSRGIKRALRHTMDELFEVRQDMSEQTYLRLNETLKVAHGAL